MFLLVHSKARIEDLIRGVAIESGNDAAITLAEGISGTEDSFTTLMNKRVAELGRPAPQRDRFGYMVLVGAGETEEEGHRFARQVKGYLDTTGIVHPAFASPPGYYPVQAKVAEVRRGQQGLAGSAFQSDREGKPLIHRTASIPDLVKAGVVFAGTPDQVFDQIKELYDYVGGFGHLLAMMHGGALSHEDTVKSLTLFSREVLPRLGELDASSDRHLQSFEQLRQKATS